MFKVKVRRILCMHIIREFVGSFILKACVILCIILNNNLKPVLLALKKINKTSFKSDEISFLHHRIEPRATQGTTTKNMPTPRCEIEENRSKNVKILKEDRRKKE